jgi:hypothetical protein
MPSVDVGFNTNTGAWVINPPTISLNGAGVIVFHQNPKDPTWDFVSANVVNAPPKEFKSWLNGAVLILSDRCSVRNTYCYTVTVKVISSGTQVTSEDPVIVNDPGSNFLWRWIARLFVTLRLAFAAGGRRGEGRQR